MSQQGDAFVRRVLHGDPGQASWSFDDSLSYLRQRAGSIRGAARAIGVSDSTVRRWLGGAHAKAATSQRVFEAARGARSRISELGDAGTILPILRIERGRPARESDVWGSQLNLVPGTTDAAHQVWITTGDADAALLRFVQGIQEPWYRSNLARGVQYANSEGTGPAGGRGRAPSSGRWDELEDLVDDDHVMEDDYGVSID
jgi:hypothetical protein